MGRLLLLGVSFLIACHPDTVSAFQAVNVQYWHFGQQPAALRSPKPSFVRSKNYGIAHMRSRLPRLSSTAHDTGVIEGVKDFFQDEIKDFIKQSALAGAVKRGLSKVRLTPHKTKLIMAGMTHAVHIEELILYFYFGWLFMPTIYAIQSFRHRNREVVQTWTKSFFKKYGTLVADHISQLSKLCFCIYVVDIIKIILQAMGFAFASKFNIANVFGRISFTLWISNRVSAIKRFVLARQTRSDPEDLEGQVQIVDRLFDALIYFVGVYVCLDTLKTKLGAFQKGFAALGGASTLLLSLASQGLLSQVLNGLFVASSNQFAKGDVVKFSNNLQGKIVNLGWTSTVLRGSDDTMVSVPNTQLTNQQISNLSRVRSSQVQQTLVFNYKDEDKIPKIIHNIRTEVEKACPRLIKDGSRPYRVHITEFTSSGIKVEFDSHHNISPIGDPYWENRQECLKAISKAVKDSGVELKGG